MMMCVRELIFRVGTRDGWGVELVGFVWLLVYRWDGGGCPLVNSLVYQFCRVVASPFTMQLGECSHSLLVNLRMCWLQEAC